jgi:4-amino-4-deoxy-L-arabinose transferase-like glycosyltransferase
MSPARDTETRLNFSSLAERARALRNRIETMLVRRPHRLAVMAGLILVYLVVTALQAQRKLWHDELFTYYIAKSPSMSRLFQEIQLDLNPPLIYLADRLPLSAFGDNSYATRLPSIVAFLLRSLCFYAFVSRRFRPVYGLLAMVRS